MSERIKITWMLEDNVPITGVRGVDYEMVPLDDLVKWAKKNRRRLRRDIKRGIADTVRRREHIAAAIRDELTTDRAIESES